MKVLFLSHQADFIFGGEVCTLSFMQELSKRGVEVHFASPAGVYQDKAKAFAKVHTISSIQFSRKAHLLPRLLPALLRTHRELRKIIKKEGIEIVHATSLKAMAYAWRLKQLPVIWHHHDILPLRFRNNLWLRTLARRAHWILTPSQATKAALVQAGIPERKTQVLHNGFRFDDWKQRPARQSQEPLHLGFIGEISERKGIDRLEGIWKLCQQQDTQMSFDIIGEGLSDKEFAKLWQERLKSLGVNFLGRRSDIPELLQKIDVLLVPSKQDPLPTVIVEACLSGVPVVAWNVGGIPEMVEHGKNGFLADNEKSFAEGVLACRDVQQWQRLSDASREKAKEYDVARLTERLVSLLEQALPGRSH